MAEGTPSVNLTPFVRTSPSFIVASHSTHRTDGPTALLEALLLHIGAT